MDQDDRKHVENKEFKDLMTLQHNVKVQPELYTDDTTKAVNVFKEEYNKVKNNPGPKNERFTHYCSFVSHVSDIFKKDLSFVPNFLYELLLNYGTILNPNIRMKCVQCIIMMRNKEVIPPIEALNIFFKLLTIKDKEMRKLIIAHIINDIKRMNVQRKNMAVNKQVQNFIYDIIKNNNDTLAKRAIFIIISLYRKQVWNDAKTVNVIASGCFNENEKVVLMACNFLIQTTEETYADDSESEDEAPAAKSHSKKNKNISKKTKAKEMRKERELKRIQRRERRKSRVQLIKNFFPIDMINNPQDFCDKLFNHLKKKNHKFEVKLAIMSVLARMIGRHKLLVMNFYPYMIKYLMPHQRDIVKILAYVAESCHELVPPDDLQGVLKHLVENFVTERLNEEKMTMGFKTINEMCERSPLMMDEFYLNYLAEYKTYKEKNVAAAARALVNYFRDVNPDLLDKKHRGRFDMLDKKDRKAFMYGEEKVCERVDGADLLKARNGVPAECDRILTDDDFRMIRVLKKRKMDDDAEKVENLNKYTRETKPRRVRNEGDEEDNEEDYEDVEDGENIEGLDDEAEDDDDDDGDMVEIDEDELEVIDGEDMEDEDDGEDDDEGEDEEEEEEGNENGKTKEAKKNKNSKKGKMQTEKKGDDGEAQVEQWEIDELTDSDEENPHKFVSSDKLGEYKLSKTARKLKEKEQEKVKEKRKWTPKHMLKRQDYEKGIKNYEKEKNKNLLMLRPKKNKQKEELKQLKSKINSMRRQLGHVRNKKEARSKMVKYQRKFNK